MHSTETALINVTDNILKAIDEKSASLLVLLDMSKAFDSLKHKISCLIATCPLDIKEYDTKIHMTGRKNAWTVSTSRCPIQSLRKLF